MGYFYRCFVCGRQVELPMGQSELPPHERQDQPGTACTSKLGSYIEED